MVTSEPRAMPTVMTHALVGVAAGATTTFARRSRTFWVLSAVLPMLPDLDVLALPLGVPHGSIWSHRGITHSLAAAVALGVAAARLAAGAARTPPWKLAAYFSLLTASHGVFDAFTNGGPGIAFLAPFARTRYASPWRPIDVSPLGFRFFTERGLRVVASELRWVWLPVALLVGTAVLRRRAAIRRVDVPGRSP